MSATLLLTIGLWNAIIYDDYMNNNFWNDALRSGAILGLVMGASRIFETYEIFLSDKRGVPTIVVIEWLLAAILFVYLLYRFAKQRSLRFSAKEGYSYGQSMSYLLLVSMLTGIIVGVMDNIFTRSVGYENIVAGYMSLIDEYREMVSMAGVPASSMQILEQLKATMRESVQPTILNNVFSGLNLYFMLGGVVSLVISAFVKREANPFAEDKNDENNE